MKNTFSQTSQSNTLKPNQYDYTNVTTQNSSQHSVHSSFQEKSSQAHHVLDKVFKEEQTDFSLNSTMEDQDELEQKQNKILFFQKSVEWLGKKYKKFKIKIQTLYVAVSYLIKYISVTELIEHKCELLSAVCLLIASKVNEIHFPSIKSIINSLDFTTNKRQILQTEQYLLELFGFQMNIERNCYTVVNQVFKFQEQQKRKNAQKLLFLAVSNPKTLEFGESYLGLSIIYLLKPQILKDNASIDKTKLKKVALVVYKMYKDKKNSYANKQN